MCVKLLLGGAGTGSSGFSRSGVSAVEITSAARKKNERNCDENENEMK